MLTPIRQPFRRYYIIACQHYDQKRKKRQKREDKPINTPYQNPRIRTTNRETKDTKPLRIPDPRRRRILLLVHRRTPEMLHRRYKKIERQQAKHREIHHLQHNTGDDDIITSLEHILLDGSGIRGCGVDAAADGLQTQTKNVKGDEDPGV